MILDEYYNHSSIIVLYWKRKGQDAEHSAEDKDYDVHFGTTGRQLHCTASQLEITGLSGGLVSEGEQSKQSEQVVVRAERNS